LVSNTGNGAAIHLTDSYKVNISNSVFRNNTAIEGGALSIGKSDLTILSNNTFVKNRASHYLKDYNIKIHKEQNLYRGGAFELTCTKTFFVNC